MSKLSFDDIYMDLASNLARKSHCVVKKVGAVISKDTRIVSLGYNGPPAGTHNCDEEWAETGCARDRKGGCSLALHAEANAIAQAAKHGISTDGASIYVTLEPCISCLKLAVSAGIREVYYETTFNKGNNAALCQSFVSEGLVTLKQIKVSPSVIERANLFLNSPTSELRLFSE